MTTNIKKTSVPGRVPNTFILSIDGDIGINTHDGKIWVSNGSVVSEIGGGSGTPGGLNTQIQFNKSGSFGGNSSLTFTEANTTLTSNNLLVSNTAEIFFKLQVGDHLGAGAFDFGELALIEGDGNRNGYLQVVIQNANTGEFSTSDFIAAADDGTDTEKYADFGINGSNYYAPDFTLSEPYDAYVYSSDGHLTLGSLAAKDIIFHSSGGNTENEIARFTSAGGLRIGNSSLNTIITPTLLDIGGQINANNTVGTAGQVLTSGAGGNAYWSSVVGSAGVQGIQGITGSQGTSGTSGAEGTQGIQGIQGTSGTSGAGGTQGIQGIQGITGSQGTSGTSGAGGTQGIQGIQGLTGPIAGSDTQIIFNDGGSANASSQLTFTKATARLTTANLTVNDTAVINTNSITIGDASLNTVITPTLLDLGGQINANNSVGTAGQVLKSGAAGNVYWDTTGSGFPSGSNTQVQFNDSGSFGGDSLLTFNKDTNTLTTANLTVNDTAVINTNSITIGDASLNTVITPTLLDLGGQINANNGVGTAGQILTSGAGGNVYWSSVVGSAGAQGIQGIQGFTGAQGTSGTNGTQGIQGITGPIAGSDTQLIFNDGGVANASSQLTFTKAVARLTTANLTVNDTAVINTNSITIGDASLNTVITPTLLDLGGQINANNSVGTAGQVLTSGAGGNAYWSSVVGSAGAQGIQGIQGIQGFTGTQGTSGTSGAGGTQGIQGIQGFTGAQGTSGTNGTQGIQGIQGLTGPIAGSDTQIIFNDGGAANASSQLTFTKATARLTTANLTVNDTAVINTNSVSIGSNVVVNTSAYFVGNSSVNTFITQNLLDLGGQINADGSVGSPGQVLTSNGAGNVYWSSVVGSAGAQGIQGIQGIQGFTGSQGTSGTNGTQGIQGIQGIQGTQGIQGRQGTQGIIGPAGISATGRIWYFTQTNSDITNYESLQPDTPDGAPQDDMNVTITSSSGDTIIEEFATDSGDPNITEIPVGEYEFRFWAFVSDAADTSTLKFDVYKRSTGGTETFLFSSGTQEINALTSTFSSILVVSSSPITILASDRIVVKVVAATTSATNKTIHFLHSGATPSNIRTAITTGFTGPQGAQGIQGIQGTQGIQGRQGIQGIPGPIAGSDTQIIFNDAGFSNASSQLTFTKATARLTTANLTVNDTAVINTNSISVGSNVVINASAYAVGNSSVNTFITSTLLHLDGQINVNDSVGSPGQVLTSNGAGANAYWSSVVGSAGAQGIQGIQGIQGFTGLQGTSGTNGTNGSQGIQGFTGAQGTSGTNGTQGIQGFTGTQGTSGTNGTNGTNGTQGIQGIQGFTGAQGTSGTNGTQGIQGITGPIAGSDTQIIFNDGGVANASSQLTFTKATARLTTANLTVNDTAVINTNSITVGSNVVINASAYAVGNSSVNTFITQNLLHLDGQINANNSVGDAGNVLTSGAGGNVYWSSVVGSAGAQGIQGIQGIQGFTGLQGTSGTNGTNGTQGIQGIQGFTGAQGTSGTNGTQGIQGIQGFTGLQGTSGTNGTNGTNGTQGIQGIQGFTGLQGTSGTNGTNGDQGIQGIQGIQGFTGAQGTSGTNGTNGTQGIQGIQGITGPIAGSDTQLIFNDGGVANASSQLTFTKATARLTTANLTVNDTANINTNSITVGSNVSINASAYFVGNSTANVIITSTDVTKNTISIIPFGQQSIWVPAVAMYTQTTTGAAAGTVEVTTNDQMIKTFDFDTTTQEFVQFAVQMPKSWDLGTIIARFVWSHAATTTNFGVTWQIQGYAYSDAIGIDQTWGTAIEITDTGGATNTLYLSPETTAITIGGTPAAEEYIIFRVGRAVANTGDNMAIDARLHGVKLHYTTNKATDT